MMKICPANTVTCVHKKRPEIKFRTFLHFLFHVSSMEFRIDNCTCRERRPRRSVKRFDGTKFERIEYEILFTERLSIKIVHRSDEGAAPYGGIEVYLSNSRYLYSRLSVTPDYSPKS